MQLQSGSLPITMHLKMNYSHRNHWFFLALLLLFQITFNAYAERQFTQR